jgi:hypothetical protein
MFESQKDLTEPPAEAAVWRYMDIARFVSLLDRSSLFFTRAAAMVDKWEGSLGSFGIPMSDETRLHNIRLNRETTYLSCWYVSEYESSAMWDLYQRDGWGVAVRSTWKDLTASVNTSWQIKGGRVSYVDPATQLLLDDTFQSPFMFKRKSFEHEQEARLILWANGAAGPDERRGRAPDFDVDIYYSDPTTAKPGHYVPVDLNKLVSRVYVSPDSPMWIEEVVEAIVRRFGYNFPVVKSDLDSDPLQT